MHASIPALVVAGGLIWMSSKAGMSHAHQSASAHLMSTARMELANILSFEFPAHDRVKGADEIGLARVDQQARGFDLQILAFHVKRLASRANSLMRPLPARAEIGGRAGDMKVAFHAPPLRALVDVSDCLEDTGWRSSNEYLCHDRVLIGSDLCSCHIDQG